jgi:ribosomal-protein-alanine N-acetyltransferase
MAREGNPMRVTIRAPLPSDQREFLAAVHRSRRLHRPWVHPPSSPKMFRSYLARARDSHESYVAHRRSTGELVGVVNLSEIVLGAFRSAYLGYYGFVPHAGLGYMTEAMELVMREAFRTLHLHRLEANIQPGNQASIALVRRLGFRREGYSPRYLKIGGRWQDHERWAILAEGSKGIRE